jgi:hypothetical protein
MLDILPDKKPEVHGGDQDLVRMVEAKVKELRSALPIPK